MRKMLRRLAILLVFICGFGAGVLATFMGYSLVTAADASARLEFVGALLGAALGSAITVGGAMYLFRWQQDAAKRDATQTLSELIDDAQVAGNELIRLFQARTKDTDHLASLANIQAESLIAARELAAQHKGLNANFARTWRALDAPDDELSLAYRMIAGETAGSWDDQFTMVNSLTDLAHSANKRLNCVGSR